MGRSDALNGTIIETDDRIDAASGGSDSATRADAIDEHPPALARKPNREAEMLARQKIEIAEIVAQISAIGARLQGRLEFGARSPPRRG